eukprot:gene20037-35518_t
MPHPPRPGALLCPPIGARCGVTVSGRALGGGRGAGSMRPRHKGGDTTASGARVFGRGALCGAGGGTGAGGCAGAGGRRPDDVGRHHAQAKQRGPFVRDASTDAELPTRARAIACAPPSEREILKEMEGLRLGADATAAFGAQASAPPQRRGRRGWVGAPRALRRGSPAPGKFVDTLVDEQLPKERSRPRLGKLEKWLLSRVGE